MSGITPHNPLEGQAPEISIPLHQNTSEHVSIIVVHKDRPEYLNICLQSIAVTSYNNNYEIIVVDNKSGKESQDFLDDIQKEVEIVRNDKNLYWSAACNKGVQRASKKSKYLIFMHSDVVITNPAWIDVLINVSQSKNSGFVGVDTNKYKMGGNDVEFIQEYLCMMTRECWNDCGPCPEQLPLVGSSFIMTLRAQNRGHSPQVMKNPICHHYKIFGVDINEWERITEQAVAAIPKLLSDVNSRSIK